MSIVNFALLIVLMVILAIELLDLTHVQIRLGLSRVEVF